MDISGHDFQPALRSILEAISKSHFLSFDLELSGIPTKQTNKPKDPLQDEGGKQTLQQRYEETKRAAERYQVLQMGLTCVEEDLERGVYVVRPYNFFLNPVPDKRLEVERDFTYQSGAVEFLLSHSFKMDWPFKFGLPYFSREEEARARSIAFARRNRFNVADIYIQPDDVQSFALMKRVRDEIAKWKNSSTPDPAYLNITPIRHGDPDYNARGFNGYQKRLIHQLIRAEYPDLVSTAKHDFVQITRYDQEREEAQLQRKAAWFEKNLASQVGLRWVVEAICPNADSVLPREHAPPYSSGDLSITTNWGVPPVDLLDTRQEDITQEYGALLQVLKKKQTILVGHNLFLDLVYFYACFFGPLPEEVEEFRFKIGCLFPQIFDTKYLAESLHKNSPLYESSLEEIDKKLSKLPSPTIEVPTNHNKYATDSPMHEAGFDSFLTAKVFIRLASKTKGSVTIARPAISPERLVQTSQSAIQHRYPTETRPAQSQNAVTAAFRPKPSNPFETLNPDEQAPNLHREAVPIMMPPITGEFSRRYANKLRVNGTVEETCVTSPTKLP